MSTKVLPSPLDRKVRVLDDESPRAASPSRQPTKPWPDYRAVWRWHFYASLFCMPFVIVLSITGAIYLFKPQIDRWSDREYDNLAIDGKLALPSAQIARALDSLPGSVPIAYELPTQPTNASRVILKHEGQTKRVFVHPSTLEVLDSRPDDGGIVRQVRAVHGQLGLGERGSNLVELAASWTFIMILTGLVLWWPRTSRGLAGVLYPRLLRGSKVFWRDIHAVTGIWISLFVIFLLASGLPWAKFWGNYFRTLRSVATAAVVEQDWTLGGVSPTRTEHSHQGHGGGQRAGKSRRGGSSDALEVPSDLTCFDRIAATVTPLNLAHPATIAPPQKGSTAWVVKSDAQNRTLRTTLTVDGISGAILSREDFSSRPLVDRLVSIGISAHEGQLFGWPNQLLGLGTAAGLVLLSVSGYVMWWRRRSGAGLGAPAMLSRPRFSYALLAIVLLLAVCLPLFGASLLAVLLLERIALARIPKVRNWLGLV